MTIKAAVLGDPISHSLSPTIHNFFLEKYKIDGSYEAIRIEKSNFTDNVTKLVQLGFSGFNVTLPHKEVAFDFCTHKSKSAQLSGAVNTIIVMENGGFFGHNSDVEGFLRNLKNHYPNFDLRDKKVGVIGAGGAARAIVYGLISSKVGEIFITNRNEMRAQKLIENFSQNHHCQLSFVDKKSFEKNLPQFDLLINSTSLGMLGQEPLDLDLKALQPHTFIYDIVYKPLMTDFLSHAQRNGNPVITGIGMLIEQALVGFELWFKTKPEQDSKLEKILIEKLTNS